MAMGGKRKKDKHLPRRVYWKHGAYWFVDAKNKWHRLASTYPEALIALAALMQSAMPTSTMEMLIAKYCAEELPKKSKATQKSRLQEFKPILKVFGMMEPDAIETHDVWNYYRARGEIEQAKHEIRALSAALTFGRQIGACKRPNPCFGLKLQGGGARDRYVTDDEYLIVRGLATEMIGYAMDLALVAGMRKADILALERRQITEDGILLTTSKDKKHLLIEWNEELKLTIDAALRKPPRLRQFVICRRDGKRYTADGFGAMWQRLMTKALKSGLAERFTFHDLRAKSASDADSDEEATARLGHNDPRTTKRVYRRLPRRAAALRILDKGTSS